MIDPPTVPISRRQALRALVTGTAAAVLAACGQVPTTANPTADSATRPTATTPPVVSKPTVVRYAHMSCWDNMLCQSQKDLIAEFNASHPSISVEPVEWSWGNYLATLQAAVSAGEAPDIMQVGWGEVVSLGRPYFIALDSYITDDLKQNINESSWTSARLDGKTYGVPVFEQLNEVLYYRSDVWQKAGITSEPKTWDEYVQIGKQLQAAGLDPWGSQAKGAAITSRFIEIQYQNGSPMFIQDGDAWKHTFNTPEAKEAGRYWWSLWQDSKVLSQTNLQRSTSDMVPVFAEGKIGMINDITQSYFTLISTYPDIAETIHLAPPATKKTGATMGGAFGLSIFQQSKNPNAAWEFIAWATSAPIMDKYWTTTGKVLPTRKDAQYPKMPDHVKQRFAEYQAVQRVFPFVPQWEEIKGKVLTPGLGQLASNAVDFDTGWQYIIDQTNFVLG